MKWSAYHLYWWPRETWLATIRKEPEHFLDLSSYRTQLPQWRAHRICCTHQIQCVGFMVKQYDTSVPRVTYYDELKWHWPMMLCYTNWPLLISCLLSSRDTNHPQISDLNHDCCVGKPYQASATTPGMISPLVAKTGKHFGIHVD